VQGLEELISGDLFKYIIYGVIIITQLYIANKVDPIKKSIERIDKNDEKQWQAIDDIRTQLNTLQGEHNIKACRGGKK
jgi:tetrahydromethanopterin S-methyltransferase subunit B